MLASSMERLLAISRDDLTEEKLKNILYVAITLLLACIRENLFRLFVYIAVLYKKPTYIMDKSRVNWALCLHFEHDKIKLSVFHCASEKAIHTESQRKR